MLLKFSTLSLILLSVLANKVRFQRGKDVNSECYCVAPNMCHDNEADIDEGEGLLDIRMGDSECENYYDVCCENPAMPPIKEEEEEALRKCGFQNSISMDLRITGSDNLQTAQFGEVSWTVAVLMQDTTAGNMLFYKCGGSLIHPQIVMTAAHCVADPPEAIWYIRAGEWNTSTLDEPLPHQQKMVQGLFIHPLYHSTTLKNDVALLMLTEPVQLADNVGLVCLPPSGLQLDRVKCVASGWGKNSFTKGKHSSILKMIELPLVAHEDCQRSLRNTRLGKFYRLHSSFLCAGGEPDRDTCKGDGGSPLVCPISGQPGRYLQMGIVSWGIGCGESNVPGVYVNVPEVKNWIDQQLIALNIDISVYNYESITPYRH